MKNFVSKTKVASSAFFAASVFLINITSAQAATFQWEFSNVIGGINGTVLGTLEVAEGNNVSATSVILTSTTNPVFNSLIGFDFTTLQNYNNRFNVLGGKILAAQFGTTYFLNSTNLSIELNSDQFNDPIGQNTGLLTIAGNPLPVNIGGDGVCPTQCLQTSSIFEENTGKTEIAPKFKLIPEPSLSMGWLVTFGLFGINQLRRKMLVK